MTKSAVAVAREALAVGRQSLPAYASKFSRRDFTLPQLFALLVLRKFFRTDYRGVVALVAEWAELRRALALAKVSRPPSGTSTPSAPSSHGPGSATSACPR